MSADEIRAAVVQALTRIAPEVDPASIQANVSLREQLDIDSVDFLNIVVAIHERLGVDIPEADYAKLATLDAAVNYLQAALAKKPAAAS
jgi:acyl carrier protein